MTAIQTHPGSPVEPPVFKGVSDLSGSLGDMVSGTYRRSVNTYVKDATTLAKRLGFQRALDERLVGSAVVQFHREASGSYFQLVGDGDGIKVVTSMVTKPKTSRFFDHIGFPEDLFERTDDTTLSYFG